MVFTWSRKIELWTTNAALDCLEIGFNSNNKYLGRWCCLEKEGVENEKRGFANKKSQIKKWNNQVVVKIKKLHVSRRQYLMKSFGKGVMMDCIPKPTNSFLWVIVVVVFWYYGSLMNTEIIKIRCIKVKNREYGRAWLISIWDVIQ